MMKKVPSNDRGFLFGDGIFTTIRVDEGKLQYIDRHLERLRQQCQMIGIRCPEISEELLNQSIKENQASSGTWRMKVMVTGGDYRSFDLSPRDGRIFVMMEPYKDKEGVVRLTIYPEPISYPTARIKSMSYLDRFWIKDFAIKKGFDDAIVVSPEGYVMEASMSNLFWVMDDEMYLPDPKLPYLGGVMLSVIRETYQKVYEVRVLPEEIPSDAKIYICNSLQLKKEALF